jgi:hypothetical protein
VTSRAVGAVLVLAAATSLRPYDSWLGAYYRQHGVATAAALLIVFLAMTAAGGGGEFGCDRTASSGAARAAVALDHCPPSASATSSATVAT